MTPSGISRERLVRWIQAQDPSLTAEQINTRLDEMLAAFNSNFPEVATTLKQIADKAKDKTDG
jgi:hypothetical protein